MGANHRLLNANMTCGDCEHLDDNGGCAEMAEALALEGWPKAFTFPALSTETSAESCPHFSRSAASRNAPMRSGWEEKVDEIYEEKKVAA